MPSPFIAPQTLAAPQQVGDFDLSKAVSLLLARSQVAKEQIDFYENNVDIRYSQGKTPDAQLYLQKRFWIHQLISLDTLDTMDERLLINQFMVPKDWFTYFANNIVSIILIHKLPTRNGW